MPLHPFYEKMAVQLAASGQPSLTAGGPKSARAAFSAMRHSLGEGPEVGAVSDLIVPTRGGAVGARLYRPETAETGLLVYLHGGGWVCGGLDDFDVLARTLAQVSDCAILTIDYRLAPEHPFPAGLEDAIDSIQWAQSEMESLIGRRVALSVGGDSAGANLAIAASHHLCGHIRLALQILFYPVTDSNLDRPSYCTFGSGLPLTRKDMRWFLGQYAPESKWADPDISPLRRPSLTGMPPTWITTAEFDVLRDEGEEFAARLVKEGCTVEFMRVTGLSHGFARMTNHLEPAASSLRQAGIALRRFSQTHRQESGSEAIV